MPKIIFISGACGSGKSTFADALARHLVRQDHKTVYVIHGDDFHSGFREPEEKGDFFVDGQASDQVLWEDILRFNWECMLDIAQKALSRGLDVLIDYVVEDELPLLKELARKNNAKLCYVVLTASEEELRERLIRRGSENLIERSLFLKTKLENSAENLPYLFDISGMSVSEEIAALPLERHKVPLSAD
jgi:predicted kinase